MTMTYRTAGDWGPGKGSNLTPAEVDANFWDHEQRLALVEEGAGSGSAGGGSATVITNVTVVGSLLTVYLSDGTTIERTLNIPRSPASVVSADVTMTITTADMDSLHLFTAGCAVLIPSDATEDIPVDMEIHFRQHGATAITFDVADPSTTTLHPVDGYDNETACNGATVTLKKIAADEWIIMGLQKVTV